MNGNKNRKPRMIFVAVTCAAIAILLFISVILMILESNEDFIPMTSTCGYGYCYRVDKNVFNISNRNYDMVTENLEYLKGIGITTIIVDDINQNIFGKNNYSKLSELVSLSSKYGIKVYLNLVDIGSIDHTDPDVENLKRYCFPSLINDRLIFNFSNHEILNIVSAKLVNLGEAKVAGIFLSGLPGYHNLTPKAQSVYFDNKALEKLKKIYRKKTNQDLLIFVSPEHHFSFINSFNKKDISAILNIEYMDIFKRLDKSQIGINQKINFPEIVSHAPENIWSSSSKGFQNIIKSSEEEIKFIIGSLMLSVDSLLLYSGDEFGCSIPDEAEYSHFISKLEMEKLRMISWHNLMLKIKLKLLSRFKKRIIYGTFITRDILMIHVEDSKNLKIGIALIHNSAKKDQEMNSSSIKSGKNMKFMIIYKNKRHVKIAFDTNHTFKIESESLIIVIFKEKGQVKFSL